MLHIKLPKGKTSDALARTAARYEARDRYEVQDFKAKLEAYRKTMYTENPDQPPRPANREFQGRSHDLYKLAGACSASTGDVYVDAQLWDEIKGDYDA